MFGVSLETNKNQNLIRFRHPTKGQTYSLWWIWMYSLCAYLLNLYIQASHMTGHVISPMTLLCPFMIWRPCITFAISSSCYIWLIDYIMTFCRRLAGQWSHQLLELHGHSGDSSSKVEFSITNWRVNLIAPHAEVFKRATVVGPDLSADSSVSYHL